MFRTLGLVAARGAMLAGAIAISASAFAQAPTDAQREAIRSACRSDYMAHCSSVPPGGLESLQCLQKNMSGLSGSCKSAVSAVETPAAAPAAKSETPAAPKAETPVAADPAKPSATAAPAAPKAAPRAAAKKPTDAPAGSAPLAAAPAVIVLRPMRPREELFVLRSACGGDVRSLCGGVAPGGGRIVQCLATNAASLSPACKDVLSQFRASQ
jgi:hypothetical protein